VDWLTLRQRIFKNMELLYFIYIKPNPNPNTHPNSNPIEYWQRINSVICLN